MSKEPIMDDEDADAAEVKNLRDALEEIERAAGRFDIDPLAHAKNVIERSRRIARLALDGKEWRAE